MYEPTAEQLKKCRSCYYWQALTASGITKCCHYLYITGQRRGPDPCDKWEPKTVVNMRRVVRPTVTPAQKRGEQTND